MGWFPGAVLDRFLHALNVSISSRFDECELCSSHISQLITSWFATSCSLLSSLAKVEAQKISERTRAGMSRARAKGVKIGRPRLIPELRNEITRRAASGETAYAIAKALHIDRPAAKYLQS